MEWVRKWWWVVGIVLSVMWFEVDGYIDRRMGSEVRSKNAENILKILTKLEAQDERDDNQDINILKLKMKHEGVGDMEVRREVSEAEWQLFQKRMARWDTKRDSIEPIIINE